MRKYIIIALAALCLFGLWPGQAQAQRGLPKQKGIQLTAGWVDGFSFVSAGRRANFYGGIAFSRYNRNSSRWLFGLEYLQKDYTYRGEVVPKAQFTGEAGYFHPLVADRGRNIVLSVGFSALAGYESTNWGNKLLHDGARLRDADCFLYGGALTAEVETYAIRSCFWLASGNGRWPGPRSGPSTRKSGSDSNSSSTNKRRKL